MGKLYFLILTVISFAGCSQQKPTPSSAEVKPEVTLLSAKDFAAELEARNGMLLDVRTPGEYKKGHLKNARLLDLFSDDFQAEINKLDTSKCYFIYCAVGGRSAEVCEIMHNQGFNRVFDLDGGFNAWKQAGLPFEQ